MNDWTMIGEDFEVRSSLIGDTLEPSELAQVDQRSADLEGLLSRLVTLHVSMVVSQYLENDRWAQETLKRITEFALGLDRAQALSLVHTLGAQIADQLVDQNGGPAKMWARFESGENPIDMHDQSCDNPACVHRVQEMFESDG